MPKRLTDEELKEVAEELGVTVEYAQELHDKAIAAGIFGTGYKSQDMRQFALKETTGLAGITTRVKAGIAGGVPNGKFTKQGRRERSQGRVSSKASELVAKLRKAAAMAPEQMKEAFQALVTEYGVENVVQAAQELQIELKLGQPRTVVHSSSGNTVIKGGLDQSVQELAAVVEQQSRKKEQPDTSLATAFKEFVQAKRQQNTATVEQLDEVTQVLKQLQNPGKRVYDQFTSRHIGRRGQQQTDEMRESLKEQRSSREQLEQAPYNMFTSTRIGERGRTAQQAEAVANEVTLKELAEIDPLEAVKAASRQPFQGVRATNQPRERWGWVDDGKGAPVWKRIL